MSANLKESSGPLPVISQGPNAFEGFLDRNQKALVGLAAVIAIGAVGVVIYRGIERSGEESGGQALNKAGDLAAYQSVVTEHANTKAAGSAMVLLADSQWTAGNKDESVATLQKFLSTFPEHAAVPTAKANLGSKLLAQGKTGDAEKVFSELAADPAARFIAPFALISLGDISKAAGDLAKAEESYNNAKTVYPESNFVETATSRLAILKAKPPVEVEAPPAPPTPSDAATTPPGASVTPQPEAPAPAPQSEETPVPADPGTPAGKP